MSEKKKSTESALSKMAMNMNFLRNIKPWQNF